jgi:Macrocin-O-methyltransferase (TylF)
LEEDWYGFNTPKGYFDLKGRLPKVRENVTLVKGWFENTLPDFLFEISGRRIDILHLDVDTYAPTKFVLHTLRKNLAHGSIIIFDEYFGYPNWRSHEFLAFQEFVSENSLRYIYIGYVEMQVAVKILSDS